MDKFKIAHSDLKDAAEAVKSIKGQLADVDACMILFFVSPTYPPDVIGREMAAAFAGIRTVGCTTAGEMINNRMGANSIVAMAFCKSSMKFLQIEVLENINADTEDVAKAFKSFEKSLGEPMKTLDPMKYVGLVIIDGLSGCEEKLNDRLGNHTNVPFVGGSAGDNFEFKCTYMFVDGKVYSSNAAILALMEPTNGFKVLKTQSFSVTDKKIMPTKVDEERRMVIEFDGKPAAETYAEMFGISLEEFEKNHQAYHVGVVLDERHYFVRSPGNIVDGALTFFCSVKEGLELTALQMEDIVSGTRADLQKCGEVKAIVDFCCGFRSLDLTNKNRLKEYSEIFGDVPTVGFATYGESYIGHMNMTSTMLLLK